MAGSRDSHTSWSDANDATLLAALKKAMDNGMKSENGWKPATWTICAEDLKGSEKVSGGAVKSAIACSRRFTNVSLCSGLFV